MIHIDRWERNSNPLRVGNLNTRKENPFTIGLRASKGYEDYKNEIANHTRFFSEMLPRPYNVRMNREQSVRSACYTAKHHF